MTPATGFTTVDTPILEREAEQQGQLSGDRPESPWSSQRIPVARACTGDLITLTPGAPEGELRPEFHDEEVTPPPIYQTFADWLSLLAGWMERDLLVLDGRWLKPRLHSGPAWEETVRAVGALVVGVGSAGGAGVRRPASWTPRSSA